MDDTPPPLATPLPGAVPSSPFGAPPSVAGGFGSRPVRAPGHPSDDPAKREAADRTYAAAREFEELLPTDARENRLAVFRLDPRTGFKRGHRPVGTVLASKVKELRLSSPEGQGALENHLLTSYGKGLYSCEPVNAHGQRLEKLAAFTVATSPEYLRVSNPDDPIDDQDEPRTGFGKRGRGKSRADDDDEDDDDRGQVDVRDMMDGFKEMRSSEAAANANSKGSMLEIMLLMSKEQRQADETRRRDERDEERKRDDKTREDRRIEEERKRDERKAEERREDERRKDADERRREDRQREEKAAEMRLTMLSGLITAAMPILQKILEPKKDDLLGTVLGKVLDNSGQQNATKELIAGMREVQTVNAQVQVEGMKSTMAMQNTMNQEFMKQAIAMARERPEASDAGGSWKDPNALAALMGGVGSLMGQLFPGRAAGAAPAGTPAIAAPQPGQQTAPAAPQQQTIPTGMDAVVRSLIALQTGMDAQGRPLTIEQQQLAYNIVFEEMPDDLAQAISTGDQAAISRISQPIIVANARYVQWVSQPEVQAWLGKFMLELKPQVAQMLKDEADEAAAAARPVESAQVQPQPQPTPAPVATPAPEPVKPVVPLESPV